MNQAGGVPSQTQSVLNELRIPVPALEIQSEIIDILDKFAEFAARRQQYEYYRDLLLTFDECMDSASKQATRITTLSEIGKFTRGRRFTNKDFVKSGVGCIHYGEVYTHYGLSASETKSFVRPELAATLRMAKPAI